MSPTSLSSLFSYKSWANRELFSLLVSLSPEQKEPLHRCVRTLNHIYVVDRIFRAHLSAEPSPFAATNTSNTPTLSQLQSDVAATDAWYEQYLVNLDSSHIDEVIDFQFTDGDSGRMSREEILLHVLTHGGYHRGNVGEILKSISVAPPRDLYTSYLRQRKESRRGA